MSDHTLDTQPENRLFDEIATLKQQILELRTLQQQSATGLPILIYPGVASSYDTTFTIAANAQKYITFGVRTNLLASQIMQPALVIHVDTDDTDHALRSGGFLSSGQLKCFYSCSRNWEYGLTMMDPNNNAVFEVQIWNLDTVSHVYYTHLKLYGSPTFSPLTIMP